MNKMNNDLKTLNKMVEKYLIRGHFYIDAVMCTLYVHITGITHRAGNCELCLLLRNLLYEEGFVLIVISINKYITCK